jgi:hypothetical protein
MAWSGSTRSWSRPRRRRLRLSLSSSTALPVPATSSSLRWSKRFAMKTFGAVRTYLGEWGATRERRAQAQELRRQQSLDAAEEQLREAYEHERRKRATVLISELSEDARNALEARATKVVRARHPDPSPVDGMLIRIESERMLLTQAGFPDFATWRSRQIH